MTTERGRWAGAGDRCPCGQLPSQDPRSCRQWAERADAVCPAYIQEEVSHASIGLTVGSMSAASGHPRTAPSTVLSGLW
jgi:hypothetical protein